MTNAFFSEHTPSLTADSEQSDQLNSTPSGPGLRNRKVRGAAHNLGRGKPKYAVAIDHDNERRFYAELRAFQGAYHVLHLIHHTIYVLKHNPNDGMLGPLFRDIRNLCPPPPREPACPKWDVQEGVQDTRIYLDEPNVAAYIASRDPDSSRSLLTAADQRLRSKLPYIPLSLETIEVGGEASSKRRIDYYNVQLNMNSWSGHVSSCLRSVVVNSGRPKVL